MIQDFVETQTLMQQKRLVVRCAGVRWASSTPELTKVLSKLGSWLKGMKTSKDARWRRVKPALWRGALGMAWRSDVAHMHSKGLLCEAQAGPGRPRPTAPRLSPLSADEKFTQVIHTHQNLASLRLPYSKISFPTKSPPYTLFNQKLSAAISS